LLRAVTFKAEQDLESQLDSLVKAGFFIRTKSTPDDVTYCFRHALIHEVAYSCLLRAHRRIFHERVAIALDQLWPEIAETQPELLAHHYLRAVKFEEAVYLWKQAGDRSLARAANTEAVAHISKALDHLSLLPESTRRKQQELALQLGLGNALIAAKGYGAPEVEQAFSKAAKTCVEVDEEPKLFSALRGLQSFYQVRGPLHTALDIGIKLAQLADQSGSPLFISDAHRRLSWCLFCMGNFRKARVYLRCAAEHDNSENHDVLPFGAHPKMLWLVNSSWIEWFSGELSTAFINSNNAIAFAKELGNPINLTYALCMAAGLRQLSGDHAATQKFASEALAVATEGHLPYWLAWARILSGWSDAIQGEIDLGVNEIKRGINLYEATGARLLLPYSLGLLASVQHLAGHLTDGLNTVANALTISNENRIHFYDAEVYRHKGAILRSIGEDAAAMVALKSAAAMANAQGATVLAARVRNTLLDEPLTEL
jgi:tetratricopeptide (TPR) repeat protein